MNTKTKPAIFIKTAPIAPQLAAATILNPRMEIQLLGDFLKDDYELEGFLSLVKTYRPDIQILHSPLAYGEDTDLSKIEEPDTFKTAHKTCQLAQLLADYYERRMPVVFHFGGDIEELKTQPARRAAFLGALTTLYQTYPAVDFYFENVTTLIFSKHPENPCRRYRDADPKTAPQLVRWLREVFQDATRFYSVLDTCHALMTVRLLQTLGAELSLEDFFKENEGVCGLIHLANARNYGIGPDHGTPFLKEDTELLEEILTLYQMYHFNCPFTLEINETDYEVYQNYQATRETLLPLLKQKGMA